MEYQQLAGLKEKTAVFEDVPAIVRRVSWPRCNRIKSCSYRPSEEDYGFAPALIENQEGLSEEYKAGLEYYVFDLESCGVGPMHAGQLPIEFFNHQLFEPGKKSEDRVQSLMEGWGLLFSPLRNDWACLDGWQFLETMSIQGVRETDALIERVPELAGIAVSKLEARSTHAVLKEIVLFLRKYIRSGGEDVKSLSMLAGPLNAAACNPFQAEAARVQQLEYIDHADMKFEPGSEAVNLLDVAYSAEFPPSLRRTGMLTSAICNQILDTIAMEDVPWRECAFSGCDAIFKYPQSNAAKLMQDVAYCCPKHGVNERKRKSRARQAE